MSTSAYFTPVRTGAVELGHRVVMSAMTRTRMDPVTEAPRDINVLYYAQRASEGGLLINEGTNPAKLGKGYIRQPHLLTVESTAAWKNVTDAVHAKGGFIFCQLMHAGRVSHPSLLGGESPLAPSAVKPAGEVHIAGGKADYETPRALELQEIPQVIAEIAESAARAVNEAGFDGIELHGGNGYLIQEFLALNTNKREDIYGGSIENRARFVLELVDACIEKIGADRVAIKLQPGIVFSDMIEDADDVKVQLEYLAPELNKRNLAFVDLSSLNGAPYFYYVGKTAPHLSFDPFVVFREAGYTNTLFINGGISPEQGAKYIEDKVADGVIFGNLFLANANLPALIKAGKELSAGGSDMSIWYGRNPADDEKGYVDWPLVDA